MCSLFPWVFESDGRVRCSKTLAEKNSKRRENELNPPGLSILRGGDARAHWVACGTLGELILHLTGGA